MSRKVENIPIAKVSAYLVNPPGLSSFTKTSDFCFESLNDSLHLSSPQLNHSLRKKNDWFTGVEMEVLIQAVNIRFQLIKNATLSVQVLNQGHEILKSDSPLFPEIQPQKAISHVIKFRPLLEGEVSVITKFRFTFEENKNELTNRTQFRIFPTFAIETRTGSAESQKIEVKMKNTFPSAVTNVFLTGPNGEYMEVSKRIEYGDIFLGIVKMEGISKDITINWDLPFSQKCSQKAVIAQAPRLPVYPLSFEFLNVPKVIKCFSPFKATVKITNHEKVPFGGKGEVQTLKQGIFPFGSMLFDIPSIPPNESVEVELEFVGMVQGEFKLPPISVSIQHLPPFQINPTCGVLLVGTGIDE